MDILGIRQGLLCLAIAVLVSGCAGAEADESELRTPPARDVPAGQVGDGADEGADGLATP
ncbi:hypothetical protein FHP29_04965 [Nocardioides albidus]|uniref:Uncharacterized protein n=1 Tax=Nocardioides albidus TaxID=1517589 RepID=A0A5C4WCT6_9ACTN|nr:hypothetical protein [Nocardioides albidus]TNM45159.1 hypothetical protein FHP29_04965 [Nocardioides albidus]